MLFFYLHHLHGGSLYTLATQKGPSEFSYSVSEIDLVLRCAAEKVKAAVDLHGYTPEPKEYTDPHDRSEAQRMRAAAAEEFGCKALQGTMDEARRLGVRTLRLTDCRTRPSLMLFRARATVLGHLPQLRLTRTLCNMAHEHGDAYDQVILEKFTNLGVTLRSDLTFLSHASRIRQESPVVYAALVAIQASDKRLAVKPFEEICPPFMPGEYKTRSQ